LTQIPKLEAFSQNEAHATVSIMIRTVHGIISFCTAIETHWVLNKKKH